MSEVTLNWVRDEEPLNIMSWSAESPNGGTYRVVQDADCVYLLIANSRSMSTFSSVKKAKRAACLDAARTAFANPAATNQSPPNPPASEGDEHG